MTANYSLSEPLCGWLLDNSHPRCRDNWGMPHQNEPPYSRRYSSEVVSRCASSFSSLQPASAVLTNAMAVYYPTTEAYDRFSGVDLVPENNFLFEPTAFSHSIDPDTSLITAKVCEVESVAKEGSRWTVIRIGPFYTTGGYDWTQIGWEDTFGLEAKLKDFPEGIYIFEEFSQPVTRDGIRLGHPPIHVHHLHISPMPGVRQHYHDNSEAARACDAGDKSSCYVAVRVSEHHGDFFCRADQGGPDCVSETIPNGFGKLISQPLGVESDLNDVRAPGSAPLEWFFEMGIRWVPHQAATAVTPINFHNFAGPGEFSELSQSKLIFTFPALTDRDSIFWYTGRMPVGGKMLRLKPHVHASVVKEAFYFAATPAEVGLAGLQPERPWIPVDLAREGFKSFDDLKHYLAMSLVDSGVRWDHLRQRGWLPGQSSDYVSRNRPRTICHAVSDEAFVDGYHYDRRAPTYCEAWDDLQKGDVFTTIALLQSLQHSLGPSSPDARPETLPGHLGWWLTTASQTAASSVGIGMYNQQPSGYIDSESHAGSFISRREVSEIILFGGTLPNFFDLGDP